MLAGMDPADAPHPEVLVKRLDAALRAERLAGRQEAVAEIRERVLAEDWTMETNPKWETLSLRVVERILDEVGVAARSAQSDSAGLTEEGS